MIPVKRQDSEEEALRMGKKDNHGKKKGRILLFSLFIMMAYGTVYSYSIFRVRIQEVYGLGKTGSGLPYLVFLFVYALSMLFAGSYIKRQDPRKLLGLSGLMVGLGWLGAGYSKTLTTLVLSYGLVIGSGVGLGYGIPIMVIANWFKEKKGMVLGLVLAGFGLSPLLTAPFGRWLLDTYGLKQTFLVFGILYAILIPLLGLFIINPPHTEAPSKDSKGKSPEAMLRDPSFPLFYTCFLIGTMVGLTMIGLTANIGSEFSNLSEEAIGYIMPLLAISNGLGRPVFGGVAEKLGPSRTMRLSYGLMSLGAMILLFFGRNYGAFIGGSILVWMNLGAWLAIAPITTMTYYGMEAYTGNYGKVFTAYGLSAVIGVFGSGILLDSLGNYGLFFSLILVLLALGMGLTFGLSKYEQDRKVLRLSE